MSGAIIVVKAARCYFLDLPGKQQVTGNSCLESKATKNPNQPDRPQLHLVDETEEKYSTITVQVPFKVHRSFKNYICVWELQAHSSQDSSVAKNFYKVHNLTDYLKENKIPAA